VECKVDVTLGSADKLSLICQHFPAWHRPCTHSGTPCSLGHSFHVLVILEHGRMLKFLSVGHAGITHRRLFQTVAYHHVLVNPEYGCMRLHAIV